MNRTIREQIRFVLEDDNEVMGTALAPGSDLDEENKQMNRELIKRHEKILAKLDKNEVLSQEDLQLVRAANEIHLNDEDNLNERHKEAIELDEWLDLMMELSAKQAFEILEKHLHDDSHTPAIVFRALHTLWEEITPNDVVEKPAFDNKGKCLKCGSRVSFADVTDTVVFVGDEVIKRYDGDITNRNCVRCTYPRQYDDFKHFDDGDEK
jgi:hypothetical protein